MSTTYTYRELKGKSIGELREIAKGIEHDAVQGYTQLNKDHLLVALAKALNVSTHEHHAVGAFDKPAIKAKMRALKKSCAAAIEVGDTDRLKSLRREIHSLNHSLRRHTAKD